MMAYQAVDSRVLSGLIVGLRCERGPRLVGQHVLILKWRLACAAYAAVCRGVRLSQYTWSGVLPSSARYGRCRL